MALRFPGAAVLSERLPLKNQLQYYASQLPTTELNGVFYRTPTPEAVKSWREQTGKDFVFAWKASKFITHWKRLSQNSVNSLELLEDRLSLLGDKAGPDPVPVAAAVSGQRRPACVVLQVALEKTPLQFRISPSELVFATDPAAAVGPEYFALYFRSSRCAGSLEAHRRLCLCQGTRAGRPLQGALSPWRAGRLGQTHQVLEKAGLRRVRLFRQRSKERRTRRCHRLEVAD